MAKKNEPATTPTTPTAAAASYEAQWRFEGFAETPLSAGDVVEAAPEDAAPFVALGVLKPLNEGE